MSDKPSASDEEWAREIAVSYAAAEVMITCADSIVAAFASIRAEKDAEIERIRNQANVRIDAISVAMQAERDNALIQNDHSLAYWRRVAREAEALAREREAAVLALREQYDLTQNMLEAAERRVLALREALNPMFDRWEPDCVGRDRIMWENARDALTSTATLAASIEARIREEAKAEERERIGVPIIREEEFAELERLISNPPGPTDAIRRGAELLRRLYPSAAVIRGPSDAAP